MIRQSCLTNPVRRLYSIENSPLAALRRKTGYSLINCKKALDLHSNDLAKAEHWLREQAQALGWARATKLQGRTTPQGIIGVLIQNNIGAMIEVNCETDFVARTEKFQEFVGLASKACVKYVTKLPDSDLLCRTEFQQESLKNLLSDNEKKLGDELALTIGLVGENAMLKRAVCFKVTDEIQLTGLAYPNNLNSLAVNDQVQFGNYGTLIALKSPNILPEELKKNICLQIVGVNPLKVGDKEKDEPAAEKEDETCLIYQDYLFDQSINVGTLLEDNQIEIVEFQRYQCGEDTDADNQSVKGISEASVSN